MAITLFEEMQPDAVLNYVTLIFMLSAVAEPEFC
jgi:hypothetical protein